MPALLCNKTVHQFKPIKTTINKAIHLMRTYLNRSTLLNTKEVTALRDQIRQYFHQTADLYERLFQTLVSDEAYYVNPTSLRHPLIFYYGHTNTFFINKLILAGLITESVNPQFE